MPPALRTSSAFRRIVPALMFALASACRSKEEEPVTAPVSSASPFTEPATAAPPEPPPAECQRDEDCGPMNCCYALKPESCVVRSRASCEGFQISCEPYDGVRYACACVKGRCTGNPSGSSAKGDAGAKESSWAVGALSPETVLDVIMKHAPDVRACQARQKKKSQGQASLHWTVTPAGKVEHVATVASTVDPALSACLVKKIETFKFPKAPGKTQVSYDFRFGR